MTIKVKACKECGQEPKYLDNYGRHRFFCAKCCIGGPLGFARFDAIALWNQFNGGDENTEKPVKIIDNFDLIQDLLEFPNDDEFYYLQIIQREKDGHDITSGSKTIKNYLIDSMDSFNFYKNDIKKLCKSFAARAYINLNRKSHRSVAFHMLELMALYIREGRYSAIRRLHDRCCGMSQVNYDKIWIIDIDCDAIGKVIHDIHDIMNLINLLNPFDDERNKYICEIPTKNGCHLITRPFELNKFKEIYPYIDVHKNNPTLLYMEIT